MSQSDELASTKKNPRYVATATAIFASIFGHMTSGFLVFMEYLSIDMKVALFAFMGFSANAALLYVLINAFWTRFKINEIFEELSVICAKSKI